MISIYKATSYIYGISIRYLLMIVKIYRLIWIKYNDLTATEAWNHG